MKVNYELYTFSIMPRYEYDYRTKVSEGDKRPFVRIGLTQVGHEKYKAILKSRFDFFFLRSDSEMPLEDFPSVTEAMLWLQGDLEEKIRLFKEAEALKKQLEDEKKEKEESLRKAFRLIGIDWRVK